MSFEKKCLACYKDLGDNHSGYHPKCSKLFFGNSQPPVLPYALGELEELAENIVKRSVTVPGVQEKLSLHLEDCEDSAGRLTLVGLWGDFILKPPVKRYPEMPEVEDLTMHLASICGIPTVPHCLIRLQSGELSYITKRVDRHGSRKTSHMEDMCQLTERLTEQKYRSSMENIAKAISKYSSHPMFDIITFFNTAVFSFLTGNAAMHLKNFSLYYKENALIQLAPAYDLVATRLLISAKDDPEESALTLNGKKAKIKRADFDTFAKTIGINEKQVSNVYKRISSSMSEMLAFIDFSFISRDQKDEFKELINTRAVRLGL